MLLLLISLDMNMKEAHPHTWFNCLSIVMTWSAPLSIDLCGSSSVLLCYVLLKRRVLCYSSSSSFSSVMYDIIMNRELNGKETWRNIHAFPSLHSYPAHPPLDSLFYSLLSWHHPAFAFYSFMDLLSSSCIIIIFAVSLLSFLSFHTRSVWLEPYTEASGKE